MAKKQQRRSLDYNYAKDRDFGAEILSENIEIWNLLRQEREYREDIWQEGYRAWSVDRTQADRGYDGRANLHMPQIRKEIETMSRRLYKGLFPDDYLRAEPIRLEDEELAKVNTDIVRHYLDNITKIKHPSEPWIKQMVIYGSSPMRSYWKKEENEQFFKKRYFVDTKDGILEPKTKVVQEKVTTYDAPYCRAEDLFQTWVYPHNAQTPEEIKRTYWRSKVSKYDLKKKHEAGICAFYPDFKDSGRDRDWSFDESQERLQQFGQTGILVSAKDDGLFDVIEVWCDILLPGEPYPVPCVVEIVDYAHCTRIQRNPYWHQKAPFDWGRYILPPPGEFYGRGLPEATTSLQHMADDMLNQTMDSATLALNNITIINPAYAPNADSFEIEPSAVWWADPNAVKQMSFPDLTKTGITNVGILRGFITEFSDNSPQLPDPIAGKARSTGQAQLAVNEWQTDIWTILDKITDQAMSPLAEKVHMLLQQNLDDDAVIRVSGKYAGAWINRIITPEQVLGRYNFRWTGALQIENQAVKTQQMLNFLKVYGSIPPEAKIQINWENFITKLLRDGFMIKDIENIIITENLDMSVAPSLEHRILDLGGEIKVQDTDDDNVHKEMHQKYLDATKDKYKRALMQKHIIEHDNNIEKKQIELQQIMAQQKMMMEAQGPKKPEGNQGQLPEATNQADMERGIRSDTV